MQPETAAVEIWSQNKLKISDLLAEQKWIQGLEKQKLKKELDKITAKQSHAESALWWGNLPAELAGRNHSNVKCLMNFFLRNSIRFIK